MIWNTDTHTRKTSTGLALLLGSVMGILMPAGLEAQVAKRWTGGERWAVRPQNADSLIAAARTAGREGRTREAIQGYEQALVVAPDRRDEISAALAFQYAWAGDLGKASIEFERARDRSPEDYDLRMGELLVTNWVGDHLAAWEGYRSVSASHPERSAPRVGMASAQNWIGRRDLALETLAGARSMDPGSRDARNLERSIRAGLRPTVGAFYDWSEDSDDYQVNGLWLEGAVSPHPQLRLIPFANILGIRRTAAPVIDETWIGITASSRPTTRLGLWGRLSVLTDPADGSDYAPVTGNLSADWMVHDRLRFGGNVEHFAQVSYVTFPDKITGNTFGLFVEGRPDWLTRVRFSGDYARYAPIGVFDANHRWNLMAAGSRQVWNAARLRVGASGRYLDFDRFQDNGIWTPDDFWALAGTAEWDWGVRDRWSVNGLVELGPAQESGGETTLFAAYRLGFYTVIDGYILEAYGGHSEGNVETGTGYDRTYAHLGLRRRF